MAKHLDQMDSKINELQEQRENLEAKYDEKVSNPQDKTLEVISPERA